MRILYATQVVLDQPHGAPRHVLAVVRNLATHGHEVSLMAPGQHDDPGPAVRRIRTPSFLRPGVRLEMAMAGLVTQRILFERPDVLYARVSPSTVAVPLAARALGVPVVLELNGRILDELRGAGRGRLWVSAAQQTLRRATHTASAVVATGPMVALHAENALGARRVVTIENGADLDVARPGDPIDARRALGLDPEANYLVFVGTLAHEQRLDLLLEAHARLAGITLVIAGAGPGADRIRRAATERPDTVRYLGAVPHPDAIRLIQAANVCANVRVGDFGMKCLEYAAVGRRIVTFAEPGSERLAPLYPQLRAVHYAREHTSDALVCALEEAFSAQAELGPLPAPAIEAARSRLGWDHTAAKISVLLEQVR